ncbi:MAG: hypothetical protein IH604_03990 [Burkholderiales bacterium]|nr:hypothetical protein [Burkholderiales bacterium]
MKIPKLPAATFSFLWGAAVGAIAISIFGFNIGGWVRGPTADRLATLRADAAIVSVLAPVCVAQFQKSVDAPAKLALLKKTDSWNRGDYVRKGGWATMPGSTTEPRREVAAACAETLNKLVM